MLTKQQLKLFMIIDERLKSDGVCPSFEEMKNLIGLKSKSGIHRLIKNLEERGFIRQIPNKARALEIIKYPENYGDNIKDITPVNDNVKMVTMVFNQGFSDNHEECCRNTYCCDCKSN